MELSMKDVYKVLQFQRSKWKEDKAFYETAKQLGMTPKELNLLFQKSKAVKEKRVKIELKDEQLKLF